MGSSTWRAGTTILWIASVQDTASTYDFHTTHGKTSLCKNRLRMFTWLLHIPNTLIYMSFRAAQDHNKVVDQDTTSSTPSWTWKEDPVATTATTCRCHSFSFNCVLNCRSSCRTIVWSCELVLHSIAENYAIFVSYMLYCVLFGGSPSGEAAKTGSSKKIPIFIGWPTNIRLYSSV
jgi:hypothetical protein